MESFIDGPTCNSNSVQASIVSQAFSEINLNDSIFNSDNPFQKRRYSEKINKKFEKIYLTMFEKQNIFINTNKICDLNLMEKICYLKSEFLQEYPELLFFSNILSGEEHTRAFLEPFVFGDMYDDPYKNLNNGRRNQELNFLDYFRNEAVILIELTKKYLIVNFDHMEPIFELMVFTNQIFIYMINEYIIKENLHDASDKFLTVLPLEHIKKHCGTWKITTKFSLIQFLPNLILESDLVRNIEVKFKPIKSLFPIQMYDKLEPNDKEIINFFGDVDISLLITYICCDNFPIINKKSDYKYIQNVLNFILKNNGQNDLCNKNIEFKTLCEEQYELLENNGDNFFNIKSYNYQIRSSDITNNLRGSCRSSGLSEYNLSANRNSNKQNPDNISVSDWKDVIPLVSNFQKTLEQLNKKSNKYEHWLTALDQERGMWHPATKYGLYICILRIIELYKSR